MSLVLEDVRAAVAARLATIPGTDVHEYPPGSQFLAPAIIIDAPSSEYVSYFHSFDEASRVGQVTLDLIIYTTAATGMADGYRAMDAYLSSGNGLAVSVFDAIMSPGHTIVDGLDVVPAVGVDGPQAGTIGPEGAEQAVVMARVPIRITTRRVS